MCWLAVMYAAAGLKLAKHWLQPIVDAGRTRSSVFTVVAAGGKKMKDAPDSVYLQADPENMAEIDPRLSWDQCEEVTWCEDQINDTDVKYLLATDERLGAPLMRVALEKARVPLPIVARGIDEVNGWLESYAVWYEQSRSVLALIFGTDEEE